VRAHAGAALAALALLGACSGGDGEETASPPAPPPAVTAAAPPPPAPAPTPPAERPEDADERERIVRAWSTALNSGDNAAAARLFGLPALIAQGSFIREFPSYAVLEQWHASLPCSGTIISVAFAGEFVVVVFELGDRPTSDCDAPGEPAAARFLIRDGRILAWQQIPVPEEPGDLSA
jgi:hypothetical protein